MGQQRMRWLDSISDSMDMSLSKLRAQVEIRQALPEEVTFQMSFEGGGPEAGKIILGRRNNRNPVNRGKMYHWNKCCLMRDGGQ